MRKTNLRDHIPDDIDHTTLYLNESPTKKNDYNLKDETLPAMDGARVAKSVIVLSYS
ncbi:hypothetical protein OIDMADRAFT_57942 [Oidiodendron maius Zn]|uniref:Uncharacterized protein n=1 Tax=Oidiodendron maius (strain Zn) TaxID=913774 RepID=A0A0C3H1R7_OIDMZ|nr:hypothetical protein OIDMADRAFT_57942 [Oidiodendron maius Zn]